MKKPFSKKLLIADYIVAIIFIIGYFVCLIINGIYARQTLQDMTQLGYDISSSVPPQLLNLDGFTTLLSVWLGQLGISSAAYYMVIRSEHRIQMPMQLINELPEDVKERVDMDNLISTVLSTSDN